MGSDIKVLFALVIVVVTAYYGFRIITRMVRAFRKNFWTHLKQHPFLSHVLEHPGMKWVRTLRVQLMIVFGVSLIAFYLSTSIANDVLGRVISHASMDYHASIQQMWQDGQNLVGALQAQVKSSQNNGKQTAAAATTSGNAVSPASPSSQTANAVNSNTAGNATAKATQQVGKQQSSKQTKSQTGNPGQASSVQHLSQLPALFTTVLNNIGVSNPNNEQFYLADSSGQVIAASNNTEVTKVNLQHLVALAMSDTTAGSNYGGGPVVFVYPFSYASQTLYLVVQGVPTPNIVYVQKNNPLATVIGLAVFISTFYLLTRRKMFYLQELGAGLRELALGKLDFRVKQRGNDELSSLAANINHMANSLEHQIEAERRAEKTKNELITNVSHDLRTPLTLIMGYLRLLKDRNYETDAEYAEYTNIAYDRAEKLGNLIGDLFEYTKLSNHVIDLNYQEVSLNKLIHQLVEELVSVGLESDVNFVREITDQRLVVRVDANQISRVFENLLLNSLQYCHKPSDITVRLKQDAKDAVVTVVNQGDPISTDELARLFDRFYRIDKSRTSTSGGSGLGLAIAKNIVELHGGTIEAESAGTEIKFTVRLPLADDE